MPETITCTTVVQLASGQQWTSSAVVDVEAVDIVGVTVPGGASNHEVQVQPGGSGTVRLMLIAADPPSDKISYTTSSGNSQSFELDAPHTLVGAGALAMLGSKPPTSLFFSNTGSDAQVRIVVGRHATP
jgi:hypothetical protein